MPKLDGDNMQAILAVFRGWATLADAPEQVFETEPTTPITSEATDDTTPSVEIPSSDAPTADTLPTVFADENQKGIFPDPDATCPA